MADVAEPPAPRASEPEPRKGKKHEEKLAATIAAGHHPLECPYTFWFHRRAGARNAENYERNIKKIGSFRTVEEFWAIYSHLERPNDLSGTCDYHLFRKGVKPMWEDENNKAGGKWIVRLRKGFASRFWEDLLLAIIGGQFDVGNEICGAVVSIRYHEDILSVWTRTSDNREVKLRIHDILRRLLSLPANTTVEYKAHDQAIKDSSSFRNTELHRSADTEEPSDPSGAS
jgi:translation initiation factor 4E